MYWNELTTGIYPWDIHDEGMETILDNLQQYAGNNAAYMLALMHPEKRPLHADSYPHNPVRKRYYAEDSRVYFTTHAESYQNSEIKPLPSDRDWLKNTDWLDVFINGLRSRSMKTGAEISHTPLDAARALSLYSDCLQRDVYGNVPNFGDGNLTNKQLCWNSSKARAYVCGIALDLASHYDLDMIQTCSLLYNPGDLSLHSFLGVVLGGCFCDNCRAAAIAQGLDFDRIKQVVKHLADMLHGSTLEAIEFQLQLAKCEVSPTVFLLEYPELYQWLQFRCNTVTSYLKELSQAIHLGNSSIDFRFNTCWPQQELFGLNLKQVAPFVDSVRMMDYCEQTGREDLVDQKHLWISNVRREIGENKPLIAGIAPRAKATPHLIRKAIKIVSDCGADGLSYGFYDGANFENLKAIAQGMTENNIVLR